MTFTVDTMAVTAVSLAVVGWTARGLWRWRGLGAREAAREARNAALNKAQETELTRLANGLEAANAQYRAHELECTEFRATTTQTLKQANESLKRLDRGQRQIQAQLAQVANDRLSAAKGGRG